MTSTHWKNVEAEAALDPELPIVDPHHHIWGKGWSHPLFEPYDANELIADKADSGHNVIATVLVDSHAQHFSDGPEAMRPVGETVYAERVAKESEQRGGMAAGACAAIMPHANLCLGTAVGEVLHAHAEASPRFRGIRHMLAFDAELPPIYGASEAEISRRPEFREGFAELARQGLNFEAWALQSQLGEVLDLARAFPQTTIVLNHLGGPLGIGRFAARRAESFQVWRESMAQLATCSNIVVKLGGIYVTQTDPANIQWPARPLTSGEFADLHRDYVLTAIDLFTPSRCMFESNFPVDMLYTSYNALWNGYKRIASGFSPGERAEMFAGVATRVYKLQQK
ncbi:amidohydrolase family protein [Cupriavidus necator]|uniref:amidohydrolase family protein n=1 Tax=Cupriavidus necator TaxID=106590 RepID=UPI003ECF5CEB